MFCLDNEHNKKNHHIKKWKLYSIHSSQSNTIYNFVAPTPLIKSVSRVRHVSVSDMTPTHDYIQWFFLSNYHRCQHVSVASNQFIFCQIITVVHMSVSYHVSVSNQCFISMKHGYGHGHDTDTPTQLIIWKNHII